MSAMTRLRSRKLLIVLAAALLIGGGGAAIAATQGSSSPAREFLDSVAQHLGVSSEELDEAIKAAAIDRVDAALEEGRITKEQADALKERIESGDLPPFLGPLIGPRLEHGFGHPPEGLPFHGHFFFEEKLSTAAEYLGLTEAELEEKLTEGSTLAEVAEAEGKSVDGLKQAIVDAARERIEEAVEDGDLKQSEADALLEGLEERIDAFVDQASFRFHRAFEGVRMPEVGPFW
jgi:hypothetical protein